MADKTDIQKIVERTLAQSLDVRVNSLRESLVSEIMAAVTPQVHGGGPGTAATLNAAVGTIYAAEMQSDILKALLDGVGQFAARAALFVVKGGNLTGWQARGFADAASIKGMTISGTGGLVARVLAQKEPLSTNAAEFDAAFIKTHGSPKDGNAVVFPLVVREKVAALIYADTGATGVCDTSAAHILVRSAAGKLEIIALKKTGAGVDGTAAAVAEIPGGPVSSSNTVQESAPMAKAAAAVTMADVSSLPAEDQEVHKKAQRFARLLVDEIKLYNQAKVDEGRQNKDLYQRLKEDIDKSRATYDKRYGTTSASAAGYFSAEVIRILADNDPSVMGGGFQQ